MYIDYSYTSDVSSYKKRLVLFNKQSIIPPRYIVANLFCQNYDQPSNRHTELTNHEGIR